MGIAVTKPSFARIVPGSGQGGALRCRDGGFQTTPRKRKIKII